MKALTTRLTSVVLFVGITACSGPPAEPAGTGSLILEIVPVQASVSGDSPAMTVPPGLITGATPDKGGVPRAGIGYAARAAAPPPSPGCSDCGEAYGGRLTEFESAASQLDRVEVRLTGPTNRNATLTNNGTAFEGTIDGLAPGLYQVKVVGFDVGQVTFYGSTSNVRVNSNQATTATVAFNRFVSTLEPFLTPTFAFSAPLQFSLVPGATTYRIEVDTDANFSAPVVDSVPDNVDWAWFVIDLGTYNMRIRAGNGDVPSASAAPSNVEAFVVVGDTAGNTPATAFNLGNGPAAAGRYFNINITPLDQDWFRVGALIPGNQLGVRVLSSSLVPVSGLDPTVVIQDAAGNIVASNDDADSTTLESAIAPFPVVTPGDYFIGVRALNDGSVGHYELELTVTATIARRGPREGLRRVMLQDIPADVRRYVTLGRP